MIHPSPDSKPSRHMRLISMSSVILMLLLVYSLARIADATRTDDDSLILMDDSGVTEEPCPCSPETEKCCPFLVCCKITETPEVPALPDPPPAISSYDIKVYAWTIITVSLSLCFLVVICLFWPICPLYYSNVCYVKYDKDVAGCADQYGDVPSYYQTSMPCEDPPLGNVLVVSHQPSLMTLGKDREVAV